MLSDHCIDPKNPQKPAKYLVIFFHGYGSSGALMADYAGGLLSPLLKDAKLVFPDGPIKLGEDKDGTAFHSWFDIQDMLDKPLPDKDVICHRATAAAKNINAYIDAVIKREGIPADRVIVAGFSQGATMAYYAGLLRPTPLAGVFSLSGGALDRLDKPQSKPPVALHAGILEKPRGYCDAQQVEKTYAKLEQMGFCADYKIFPDQEHDISPQSMQKLADFVQIVTSDSFKARMAQKYGHSSSSFKPTKVPPPLP